MLVSNAANSATFQVSTPSDREIRLTRLFNAPRHIVFDAMTRPEHVKRWWGNLDDEHSVPVCEIDLRVGGAWRFVSRFSKGEAAFHGVYRELAPPDRLVFTEIFEPYPDEESLVTAVFTEENGQTRMNVTALYSSIVVRDMVIKTGMAKGAALSYDRLEDVVREMQQS